MDDGMSGFYVKAGGGCNGVAGGGDSSGGIAGKGSKCGRWNPTAEQVKVLTELFRSGLRTPSSDQIQKISQQLSFYGKIESKNVFYWFQNHKARERQKRRRVSVEEREFVHHYEQRVSTANQMNTKGMEPERVTKTLQLFPLNSIDETESAFTYKMETQMDYHPPLELRLSFL